jgi:AcrR family transcriptional regulator
LLPVLLRGGREEVVMTTTEPGDDEVHSLHEDHRRLTRARLINAGAAVFRRKGYSATSTQHIVDEAKVSRGTFYLHFKGKAEVLEEVFEQNHQLPAIELVRDLVPPDGKLDLLHLQAWIGRYVDLYADTCLIVRAWIQGEGKEGAKLGPAHARLFDRWIDAIASAVRDTRAQLGFDTPLDDARLRGVLMFAELERYCYYTLIRQFDVGDRDRAIELLARGWYQLLSEGAAANKRRARAR